MFFIMKEARASMTCSFRRNNRWYERALRSMSTNIFDGYPGK